jgi:PAS domain S-box-containing protein
MEASSGLNADARPRGEITGSAPSQDVTAGELLQCILKLEAREPHVSCREGTGPLAPLAAALNRLAHQRTRAYQDEHFGVQALLTYAPSYMFTCDLDARIRFINRVQPNYSIEQLLGTSLYEWLTPDTVEGCRESFRKVRASGMPCAFEVQTRFEVGSDWYGGQVGPIKQAGEVVGFTIVVTDISEHKRIQHRLERSNRELENFAYVASHDLQEPLRKIQTFGERLAKMSSGAVGPEGRDYIERMQGAAVRMRRLIDDLLTYSRLSSKSRPFTRVELTAIAHEVMEDLETAVERTGAHVTIEPLPVLEADAMQMRQLLQNLVGNALKFHRQGVTPVLRVSGTVRELEQECLLVVEDNGIGFDEKYVDRIFNVFQRLHGREQYEGTGIGLAICRKIAEQHGGRIGATSQPGVGSTFSVTLPLHANSRR